MRRRAAVAVSTLAAVVGLFLGLTVDASTAAAAPTLLSSGVATSAGSWVVLPMGELSVQANTFWQVLHAVPGVTHWSVVTPRGSPTTGDW